MELKELKKRFINKYKDALKLNNEEIKDNKRKEKENFLAKKECTYFLFFNCFYIMKIFDNEEFIKNYNNGLKIIEKLLGKQHYITLKMLRINNNNNKLSIENIFMNDGKTNILNDKSFENI